MLRVRHWTAIATAVLALGLIASSAAGQTAPGGTGQSSDQPSKIDSYVLPGDMVFPEGVAYQPETGDYYVSSTTDGTIFRGYDRDKTASVFLPGGTDGRTSATGMKVDKQGRLFVSGAATGQMFVYDTVSGALLASFNNGKSPTFVNDVALTDSNGAFFTDSNNPVLYRVFMDSAGQWQVENWLDFTGTPLVYQQGFNVNGIAASQDGRYLVVVQSNTGKLYRITVATKAVMEIDLFGATVPNGDGILLRGRALYVSQNEAGLIADVRLTPDLSKGLVVSRTGSPSFGYPTTIAFAGDDLLVVNSQFNNRGPGLQPVLPFTLSRVPLPLNNQ
jgi:Cu-Zn family superoxide dismutase